MAQINTALNDGTNTVAIAGDSLKITNGQTTQTQTLNLSGTVAASNPGSVVDAGSSKSNWTGFTTVTGTVTGTLVLELSLDGVLFLSSSVTSAVGAPGNFTLYSIGRPGRYARVSLNSGAGTGTVVSNMMAA
jgi:autotransporter translocation and assembly factor TamB